MTHHLKTAPEYFQAVIDGKKPMEIRNNDRGFKPGDRCILKEYIGSVYIPECPDRYVCPTMETDSCGEEYINIPPDCKRRQCMGYTKELYTGRDCLLKIKDIYDLTGAGLPGYVAFTFDILNIREKKGNL